MGKADMETEETKKCARCGVEHRLHHFSEKRKYFRKGFVPKIYRSSICKSCESKERNKKKTDNPFEQKARDTISHHAQRMNMTIKQFLNVHDLTVEYIAMLFKREWKLHELGFVCLSCEHPHAPDLSDFTLDLIDPTRPPTRSNLRVICRTCNIEKGTRNPTEYDLESAEYRKNARAISKGVQFDLPERKSKTTPKNTQLAFFNNADQQ